MDKGTKLGTGIATLITSSLLILTPLDSAAANRPAPDGNKKPKPAIAVDLPCPAADTTPACEIARRPHQRGSDGPQVRRRPAPASDSTTAAANTGTASVDTAVATPEADYSWSLDGDGRPETGSSELSIGGAATWSPDGLVLDGATSYATTPEPGPIDTTKSFTVMAWVKPDGVLPYAAVVSELGDVAGAFFLGYGENVWNFALKSSDGPGGTQRVETGIVYPVPTTWVHLAGVYDSDLGWAQLYVNGHPATTEGIEIEAPFAATGALHIGNAQADAQPANFWSGTIADVRVYTSALDDDQVSQIVESTAPAAASLDAPPPPVDIDCPTGGGTCLGSLAAGTYSTTTFQPSITYTVPDGWVNGEDLPGNFLLQLDGDVRYLGIYLDATAPLECDEAADPDVGLSIEAWSDWLTSHPGLVTTEPQPVNVGGLDGVYIDIGFDPSWTTTCPYSAGQPVVPFIIGGGISGLHHVILPGFEERLYLLDHDGGNIAIEIGPEGGSLDDYLELVEPIIDSLQFNRVPADTTPEPTSEF